MSARRPRLVEDEWEAERAFDARPRFRRRQWVAALVLVLVLFLSGFAALVPRLFRAPSGARALSAAEETEIERELAALGPRVREWVVAHAGGFPARVEQVTSGDASGADVLDPFGRPYVLRREGARFSVALEDGSRVQRFEWPLVLVVGELAGETVYVLDGRETRSLDELEQRLRALAEARPAEPLRVVSPPGTPRERSAEAADRALRAGFDAVDFVEAAR